MGRRIESWHINGEEAAKTEKELYKFGTIKIKSPTDQKNNSSQPSQISLIAFKKDGQNNKQTVKPEENSHKRSLVSIRI